VSSYQVQGSCYLTEMWQGHNHNYGVGSSGLRYGSQSYVGSLFNDRIGSMTMHSY
jgi:hypothetical protein